MFIYLAQKSINHVTTVKFLVSKSQNALRLKCRTTMSNSTNRELVKFICYVFLAYLLDKSVKAVPGDYVGRYEILFNCVTLRILLKTSIYHLFHIVDFILCRSCGHEILHPSAIIQVPSKVAHRQRNDTIAGRNGTLIQLFKNPDGI